MLLTRLQREHEATASLHVLRHTDDAARHAADVVLARREEAENRPAVAQCVAERLPLGDGDVSATFAWALQDGERDRVDYRDEQRAGIVSQLGRSLEALDKSVEVGALHDDRGGLVIHQPLHSVEVGYA